MEPQGQPGDAPQHVAILNKLLQRKNTIKIIIFVCYLGLFVFELLGALYLPKDLRVLVPIAAGFGVVVAFGEFLYDLYVLKAMRIVGLLLAFGVNIMVIFGYHFNANLNSFGMFTFGMSAVVAAGRFDEIVKYQHPDAPNGEAQPQPQPQPQPENA